MRKYPGERPQDGGSAAADGLHHFDAVAGLQGGIAMARARHDLAVALDGEPLPGYAQFHQQGCDGAAFRYLSILSIDEEVHGGA